MNRTFVFFLLLLSLICPFCMTTPVDAKEFPGGKTQWQGYDRYEFVIDGRICYAVAPETVADGTPWIWRARFFGHEPQTDLALLSRGFHLVYCDVADLYGSPKAVAHWNAFYDFVTRQYGFSKKAALEGMSRGGLIIYNWAAANPDKVACIYADAPVCDIKSWPGGKGRGPGSPNDWSKCLEAYGLTESEALSYKQNPIDNLDPLAKAKIPLFHVVGDADDVVPVEENTGILESRYQKLGGDITVIHKEGVGHHPHSLENPTPIVGFILKHTKRTDTNSAVISDPNIVFRGRLTNSRIKFEIKKKARVAFMGGSITEMNGFRPMVCDGLKERFPETEFSFINAGIASTCSTTGAFRLENDVLSQGEIDLLILEFAVNDLSDAGHTRRECILGMEGIVRHVRRCNPNTDIVIVYFVTPEMIDSFQEGEWPLSIASHEEVAERYGISSINLAREVTGRITESQMTWEQFGGVHPAPFGNTICAKMIGQLFDRAWREPLSQDSVMKPHPIPNPIDSFNYESGQFLDPAKAVNIRGWSLYIPDWKNLKGESRRRFTEIPMLCAERPGAELTLDFQGSAIGAYIVAGPDAGMVDFSVDGAPFKRLDLYHRFSENLHYPRTVIFANDLESGKHTLRLKMADQTKSMGHAMRIMDFTVNDEAQN